MAESAVMEVGRGGSRAGGKAMISDVIRMGSYWWRRSEYGCWTAMRLSKLRAL